MMLSPMLASAQTVSDVQNSGCLSRTRGYGDDEEQKPTIILTKEGSILSVEVQNYISNCSTFDFDVKSSISEGSDGSPCSLFINVAPVIDLELLMNCNCPFNVSFIVRDLEPNSFYLDCWWYKGMVKLAEGVPLVLEPGKYFPLVEEGKQWHMVVSEGDQVNMLKYMFTNEEVVKDGKTYLRLYSSSGEVVHNVGLLREEDKKVYFYDSDWQEEYLLFDYSLKPGDIFETISYDDHTKVSYKVLSVGDCLKAPEIIYDDYNQVADSIITNRRYLREWTICRTDNEVIQKTWIEGIGSYEGPKANLYDSSPISSVVYLAYVEDGYGDLYLPFSFKDKLWGNAYGCNLPTGAEDNWENDGHHHLTYELEGNCLHVFGKVFTQCGPNNYAYFFKKPTDDPLVNKIEFVIQEVGPLADCMAHHTTNFYVSGFDPNKNYIVVDNYGEEHPVINKTPQLAYRPFVEEGKVWKVGDTSQNPVQSVEYYYFDGDTIIDGKTCKQMMCQRYRSPDYQNDVITFPIPALRYVGAWYEEDNKVYYYDINNQLKMMYDFSLEANDTLLVDNEYLFVVGPKLTGGLKGFKGIYRDIMWYSSKSGNSSYSTTWLEGVGSIDGPTNNVFYSSVNRPPFLMSCTVGDEVIYLNDEYEDGTTPEGARKGRFDFTHTIKTKPKAPKRSVVGHAIPADAPIHSLSQPDNDMSGEERLYGEYNDLRLGINLDPLDDVYQVCITNTSGKVVYEKAINAGSIVGLDIDISAYAKGRYTVTVENSQESFTGEFETQTSGISDASRLNDKGKMINDKLIYNLQGQRIRSLQKGLNIVNGQKIYVK